MNLFGYTRSTVQRDHALLCPDSHIIAPLPGWTGSDGIMLISPQMGSATRARFSHFQAIMQAGASAALPLHGVERFVYVMDGSLELTVNDYTSTLTEGGYAYLSPDVPHVIEALHASRLNVFEKPYLPLPGTPLPDVIIGQEQSEPSESLLGDPDLQVKMLLPSDDPSYDMAVNIMTFNPGAALGMVEVHVMEHGLLMLDGQGIYRLGESWYPVKKDDAIWMAPYCPQWFTAVGKSPARYLLYKDMNRDPLYPGPMLDS